MQMDKSLSSAAPVSRGRHRPRRRPSPRPAAAPCARLPRRPPKTPEPAGGAARKRRLPVLLRRAWFSLNQTFRRFSAQAGITPDQFTVLRTLAESEPRELTQHDLAEKMSSDPNTITSLLARMEEGGLIERKADPADRRARRILLQPGGRRKYERARPFAVDLQARILRSLPDRRRAVFLRELEIVADACRQALQGRR